MATSLCVVNTGQQFSLFISVRDFSKICQKSSLTHGFDYVNFVFDIRLMFLSGLIYNNWAGWILVSHLRSRTSWLGKTVDEHMGYCQFDLADNPCSGTVWGPHAVHVCDVYSK